MRSVRSLSRRAQAGFTLIELVVVITILGILAAVALPRFTSLQSDARAAKIQAIAGSVRAAAAQVKATALVKGVNCATAAIAANASVVSLERTSISLAFCYPDATATGIVAAANVNATNDAVTIDTTTTAGTAVIALPGYAGCNVTYVAPTATDGQPSVTVNGTAASGC